MGCGASAAGARAGVAAAKAGEDPEVAALHAVRDMEPSKLASATSQRVLHEKVDQRLVARSDALVAAGQDKDKSKAS